jgi:hypothetical protein
MQYSTEEHCKKIDLLYRLVDRGDASNKEVLLELITLLSEDIDYLQFFLKEAGNRVKIVQSTLGHLEEYKMFAYIQEATLEFLGITVTDFFDFNKGIYALAQKFICYFMRIFLGADIKMIADFMCIDKKDVVKALCYVKNCFDKELVIKDMQGKKHSPETVSAWVSKKLETRLSVLDI